MKDKTGKFKEVEFKYDATNVQLTDFEKSVISLKPKIKLETSSWDFYYTDAKGDSIRYRKSEIKPELTIKRKLDDENNFKRIEINIQLGMGDQDETVESFVNLLGYKKDFKIYKSCFIYYFDEVDLVYYIVYDENMRETGRFIEIEYLEEKGHDKDIEHLVKTVEKYEKKLSKLGLSKKSRLNQSLFEMFRRK